MKERLWVEVCESKDGNAGHCEESEQYGASATVWAMFCRNVFFTTDTRLKSAIAKHISSVEYAK